MTKPTNVGDFISELDAGVFEEKMATVISEVAAAVIDHDKAGKVIVELNMKRIGTSHQVAIAHSLKYTRPTAKGKIGEENQTETPMHVGTGGRVTLFPEHQEQMFTKTGDIQQPATKE